MLCTWGNGDTTASLATKLASAINSAAGSYVTASANSTSVQLVSTGSGLGVNYAVSVSIADTQTASYPTLFPSPSFTASAANMSGGGAPGPNYGVIYSYMIPQGGYAPNGNILAHTDSVMGDWLFSYDVVDRLTAAAAGGSAPSAFRGQNAGWSYDSYGNRSAQSFSNSVNSSRANYNPANNRITTASTAVAGYVYDASGNTLYDGNNEYWYDAEGQLCAVQSQAVAGLPITQYIYDAEGARIGKGTLAAAPSSSTSGCTPFSLDAQSFTITTRYLVDLGGNQVTELSEQSGEVWKHSNVFSAARLTATYDTSGLHYALADPLGTKRIQANISGQIEESCISLPFGDALSCTPTALATADDATEHHFTQKERDAESGNDYFGARYYASSMGRMMSPDPHTGTLLHMLNPQRWNMYSYAINNPLIFTDPTGMDAIVVDFKNLALGLGHVGIASVHRSDGSVMFGDFGPEDPGVPIDFGNPNVQTLDTKIVFGPDGKPTQASLNAVASELANREKQPADSIRLVDFKTTDAETSYLDTFMTNALNSPAWNLYFVGPYYGNVDCRDFLREGLNAAGLHFARPNFSRYPNWLFNWFSNQPGATPLRERVTHRIKFPNVRDKNGD